MFTSKSKSQNKAKRPASASTAGASSQGQKPAEKAPPAKAPSPQAAAPEAQEARPAKHSSSLNPHLHFEGNLKFSGTLLLDCDFRGTVVTDDTLVVGVSANVHAEVTAGVVEISGKVHGNVKATTSVKIFSGGEVHGNIETPTISMEEGVIFEGNCTRPGSRSQPDPVVQPQPQVQVSEPARPAQVRTTTVESSLDSARKKLVVSAAELAEMH